MSEWFGELPKRWDSKRIGALLQQRKEKNDPVITDFILSLSAAHGVVPYTERVEKGGNKPKSDLTKYSIAHDNDLLVNCMNVLAGSCGVSKWHGTISPVYYALYPRNADEINIWYYNYIFRLVTFYRSLIGISKGILVHESSTGSLNTIRLRVAMQNMNYVMMPLPSRNEQDQIVRFLDWKVSGINKLINTKKKLIALLQEQKRAVIKEAIPETGDVVRFRHLFTLTKGLNITKDNLVESGVPCVSYGQIHSKYGFEVNPDVHKLPFVPESYLESNPQSLMQYGDFVFADTSEDMAGSGNFTYLNSDTPVFAGYHTIIARCASDQNHRYLAYYLDSPQFRSQIQQRVNGVKVFSITRTILNSTVIVLPTADEQTSIAKTLDIQCSNYARLIDAMNAEITLLHEYRTRLISDVVTGKMDVRDVVIPNYETIEETAVEEDDLVDSIEEVGDE